MHGEPRSDRGVDPGEPVALADVVAEPREDHGADEGQRRPRPGTAQASGVVGRTVEGELHGFSRVFGRPGRVGVARVRTV